MPHCLRIVLAAASLAACAFTCAPVAAQAAVEPMPDLRLSGFGTLGVEHADVSAPGWGFQRDASQPWNSGGTRGDIDSRLGLQANYTLNERLELVGQVVLKRRVASSTPEDSLEWAFVAYRPSADVTIRAGRTSPDIFLLSDYRNVGFAYAWIRPNVETYGLLPIFSVEGADIAKVWDFGDVRWRAKGFIGQGRSRLPNDPGSPDLDFKIRDLAGGVVSRESGGLLLRATVAHMRGGMGAADWKDSLREGLGQIQMLLLPQVAAEARQLADGLDPDGAPITYFALGASYESGPWLFSGEAVRVTSRLSYAQLNSGYLSVGRRFGAVTLFGMAGAARSLRAASAMPQWAAAVEPIVGAAAAQQIQAVGTAAARASNSRIDQRSLSLGLRWDFHPQLALKLQWDHFVVRPNGGTLWGNQDYGAAHANVGSAVLDFVF